MTMGTGAGMGRGRRVRSFALVAALGAVVLTGCDEDAGEDGADQTQVQAEDMEADGAAGGAGETGGNGGDEAEQPAEAEPAPPPTEPADIVPAPGDRSASMDGGTITVEDGPAAFVSPTGNIACVVNEQTATCQTDDMTYQPGGDQIVGDLIGECSPSDADAMTLSTAGGAWTCPPEQLIPAAALEQGGWWAAEVDGEDENTTEVDGVEVAVLPYGQTLQVGPVSCSSEDEGVTCSSEEMGREFFLSRSGYRYS